MNNQKIYELINPSDTVTFYAENDQIAFCAALILGNGKFDAVDTNGKSLGVLCLFMNEEQINAMIQEKIGCDLSCLPVFVQKHKSELISCFQSFAYIAMKMRDFYDRQIDSLQGDTLQAFKNKWEEDHRTSVNRIVLSAWKYARSFENI